MKDLKYYLNEFDCLFEMTKSEAIEFFKRKRAESLVTLERLINRYISQEKNQETKWELMTKFGYDFLDNFKTFNEYNYLTSELYFTLAESEWEDYKQAVKVFQGKIHELIENPSKFIDEE